MPLTQVQAFDLTRSSKFTSRVQFCLAHYADYCISAADSAALNDPGYGASKTLARRIQNNTGGMASEIALSLVTDPTITNAATTGTQGAADYDSALADSALNSLVESRWNSRVWDGINV